MPADGLRVELGDDGVGVVTFDRAATLNSLTAQTVVDLVDAFRQFDKDDDCGAVVVTGANGAFCTGMDLSGNALSAGDKEPIRQVYEGMRHAAGSVIGAHGDGDAFAGDRPDERGSPHGAA